MNRPADHRRTALICGATGQDGCYLAAHLLARGYRVIGTSRQPSPQRRAGLHQLGIAEQVHLTPLDLADQPAITAILTRYQPDLVFHLAAQSSVARSLERPAETFESIATTTRHMLEAVRTTASPPRLFVAGSSEMFGTGRTEAVTPSSRLAPQNPYGMAKATAFEIVREYRQRHGLFACTGVLFNHESPLRPQTYVTQKIAHGVCSIAAGKQQELHLGDLSIERDWGWAPEYVVAMERILSRDTPDDFLIATGQSQRLEAFVAEAFRSVNLDWQQHVVRDERFVRPHDGGHPVAALEKTATTLGWTATVFMPEVARRLVAAQQAQLATGRQRAA